jgi:hypothetical protein
MPEQQDKDSRDRLAGNIAAAIFVGSLIWAPPYAGTRAIPVFWSILYIGYVSLTWTRLQRSRAKRTMRAFFIGSYACFLYPLLQGWSERKLGEIAASLLFIGVFLSIALLVASWKKNFPSLTYLGVRESYRAYRAMRVAQGPLKQRKAEFLKNFKRGRHD